MSKLVLASITLLFLAFVSFSCKNNASAPPAEGLKTTVNPVMNTKLPDGFEAFYTKFHEDSLYQMDHIQWPLPGETVVEINGTPLGKQTIQWKKEDWRMHRPFDAGANEFTRDVQVTGDMLVTEVLRYTSAPYGLERRFAKFGDEWQLIYYFDLHNL